MNNPDNATEVFSPNRATRPPDIFPSLAEIEAWFDLNHLPFRQLPPEQGGLPFETLKRTHLRDPANEAHYSIRFQWVLKAWNFLREFGENQGRTHQRTVATLNTELTDRRRLIEAMRELLDVSDAARKAQADKMEQIRALVNSSGIATTKLAAIEKLLKA